MLEHYLGPFQYRISLVERPCKVWNVWDRCLEICNHCEIWLAPRRHYYRGARKISKPYTHFNIQSHGFETSLDLTIRRLIKYWNGSVRNFGHACRYTGCDGKMILKYPFMRNIIRPNLLPIQFELHEIKTNIFFVDTRIIYLCWFACRKPQATSLF